MSEGATLSRKLRARMDAEQQAKDTSLPDHDGEDEDAPGAKKSRLDAYRRTVARTPRPSVIEDKKAEESEDEDLPEDLPEGTELLEFENSFGKKFMVYISDEVRNEVKQLDAQARAGKPVTAHQLKYLSTNALEMLLKYNDRPIYRMTKNECAATVAEYINKGCPPRCPRCKIGALRYSNGKKKYGKKYYWCPGSTKNGRNFYGCGFRAKREEIERNPWKCP